MSSTYNDIDIKQVLYEKEKYKFFLEKYGSLLIIIKKNEIIDANEDFISHFKYQNIAELQKNNKNLTITITSVNKLHLILNNKDQKKVTLNLIYKSYSFDDSEDHIYLFSEVPEVKPTNNISTSIQTIFEDVFNNLTVKTGVVNIEGDLIYRNYSLKKLLHLNNTERESIKSVFHKNDLSGWEKLIRQTIKKSKVCTDLLRLSNQSDKYYEVMLMPYVSKSTNEPLALFMARDFDEVYGLQNEKIFKRFTEKVNDGIIIWDKNKIHYVNPAFEKIFGIKQKEIQENRELIYNMIHPDDKLKVKQIFRINESGKRRAKTFQYKIIKENLDVKWLWHRTVFLSGSVINADKYASVLSDITEQKELEFKLANVKSQQRAIMDNIPHLIWLKDSEGKYVTINKAFAQYHGKDYNDVIGKTDFDLNSIEQAEKTIKNDIDVMRSGNSYRSEDFSKSVDGNNWIETFKTPILNETGQVNGITGIAMNITERKKMEVMIKDSEARFRSLLQNSSDAITILDRKGNIIYENAEQGKISKFAYEDLWGKSVFNLVHNDDIPIFKEAFEQVLRIPQNIRSVEFRGLNVNRKWVYVESILTNQLANPAIRGIVINSRDITERKLSELKERVYQDNLIFLSNSALELMGLSQLDNIYDYISDKMNEYLNNSVVITYSHKEDEKIFKAVSYSGIKHEDLVKIEEQVNKKIIGSEIPIPEHVDEKYGLGYLVKIKKDEDVANLLGLTVENYLTLKQDYLINKVYAIRLARDKKILGNILILTRRKQIIVNKHIIETFVHQVSVALHRAQLEYELVKAKIKAEESDKLKSAFLANMSHEIRTPINGILGFIELIENKDTTEGNRKKYIDIIYNNSKILVNLIDDIIDISKIEAEQIKIEKKDISLNVLMNQVYTSFLSNKLFKDKKEVKLRMKKSFTNDNSNIKTDPVRLRQVLTNLVGNAYKFTEKGYIEFGYRLSDDSKTLIFYVKDTGIGIPKKKKELIFDRFTQVDHSASRKYGGSGLGLAISKAIIELLNGEMSLESEEGIGSVFTFTVPYEHAEYGETEKRSVKRSKINYDWSKKTLLIAEDDKFSFKFLETFLQQTKINIIHAEDGKKAVKLCKQNKNIDLVLMDIQMPEMNGYEATRSIKKLRKSLPIIAQTANALEEERKKCFAAGCDDYLTKPISIREILFKIDEYLKNK